jgi:hypothetical protein
VLECAVSDGIRSTIDLRHVGIVEFEDISEPQNKNSSQSTKMNEIRRGKTNDRIIVRPGDTEGSSNYRDDVTADATFGKTARSVDFEKKQDFGFGKRRQIPLLDDTAESKSLLEKQLLQKERECELAQAELAALQLDGSCLGMRRRDFSPIFSTQNEALVAAVVELATVRESLRSDLEGIRQSNLQAVIGQEELLGQIRRELDELTSNLLRKDVEGRAENQVRIFCLSTFHQFLPQIVDHFRTKTSHSNQEEAFFVESKMTSLGFCALFSRSYTKTS